VIRRAALAALPALWVALVWMGGPPTASGSPSPWGGTRDDIDGTRSVPLRASTGAIVCSAAPAAGGFHTAAHCLERLTAPRILGEVVTGWSVDADGRDVGHVQTAGAPDSIATTTAVAGDLVTARLWGGDVVMRVAGLAGCTRIAGGIEFDTGGWSCAAACVLTGRHIRFGDSGSGVWAHGAVWAIVVAADVRQPTPVSTLCDRDQIAFLAIVP